VGVKHHFGEKLAKGQICLTIVGDKP
jgi:hypothetical protein